jgi:hypothetical protein
VISRETIKGTTVIRIAFTHSVPIGSTIAGILSRTALSKTDTNIPPISPTRRLTKTRTVDDIA